MRGKDVGTRPVDITRVVASEPFPAPWSERLT